MKFLLKAHFSTVRECVISNETRNLKLTGARKPNRLSLQAFPLAQPVSTETPVAPETPQSVAAQAQIQVRQNQTCPKMLTSKRGARSMRVACLFVLVTGLDRHARVTVVDAC